ncbi:MAG: disulfide bond formation protein DsbA [Massilia sp.]|jgi:2-hydroxychromene-2-carboxylate isomerase|nr:disulfide bond formation protein DsbA [Massilia sp.]
MQKPSLEFWYEFGSNYSYLSVMRIEALAREYGVAIAWKPFLLGPIFKSFGWNNSPFVLQKEKGAYVWKDLARQCAKYGLPLNRPTTFPRGALLAMRVALLGADQPWIGDYSKRMMQLNFVLDQDFNTPEAIGKVLAELGLPAASLLAEAQSDANKERLRAQTEAARNKGVFGAPTFFVGDEMFWGDDRLLDALQFAAGRNAA